MARSDEQVTGSNDHGQIAWFLFGEGDTERFSFLLGRHLEGSFLASAKRQKERGLLIGSQNTSSVQLEKRVGYETGVTSKPFR